MKRVLKIVAIVLAAIILVAGGYFAYVMIAYHRLGSGPITPEGVAEGADGKEEYSIVTYNIGFGAYEPDYGFFMDGGSESWAWSEERLDANMKKIASFLKERDADFYVIQEVDIDSTRTYHVDERKYLSDVFGGMSRTFAQNYDSPFLFYPIINPHGSSKSGLVTLSKYEIKSAERVELPIETGFTKFLDLDRCYSKNRITTDKGHDLVLYDFHLSAYTSDGTIATEQLKLLLDDIEEEYKAGNYCVAGGDFNKDILGDSSKYFGKSDKEYTWAQPIPEGTLDKYDVTLVAPVDEENPVPTTRNADGPYHKGQYVVMIDGFLVSANVEVTSASVIDTEFAYSDHNPVTMTFKLK